MNPSVHPSTPAKGPARAVPHGPVRLLITAGPTQEPIDSVRYIGNRSSGRLGVALADAAAKRNWQALLLLGPTPLAPSDSRVDVARFRTTAELEDLLRTHVPGADILIMAAAVADFRPAPGQTDASGKFRRDPGGMTLRLEPTPDLLAACAANKRPGQFMVGFALEPRDRLLDSARSKLQRKGLDLIVANPLETMDSPDIEATIITAGAPPAALGGGPISKRRFADMLLDEIQPRLSSLARPVQSRVRST